MYSTEWRILDVWRCFRWRRCCCWYRRYSCCSTFPATPFVSTSSSSRPSTHRTCPIVFSSSFRKSSSSCSTSTLPQTSSCTALRGRRSGAPPTGWCGARHGARRCGLDACGDVGGRRRSLSPRTSLSSRRRLNPLSPVPVNCSEAYRSNHRTTNSVYTGAGGFTGWGTGRADPHPVTVTDKNEREIRFDAVLFTERYPRSYWYICSPQFMPDTAERTSNIRVRSAVC